MIEHVTDPLSEYLDHELSAADRSAVDAHLRTCAVCLATIADFRRIVQAAGRAAACDMPPSRDLWPAILARIQLSRSACAMRLQPDHDR